MANKKKKNNPTKNKKREQFSESNEKKNPREKKMTKSAPKKKEATKNQRLKRKNGSEKLKVDKKSLKDMTTVNTESKDSKPLISKDFVKKIKQPSKILKDNNKVKDGFAKENIPVLIEMPQNQDQDKLPINSVGLMKGSERQSIKLTKKRKYTKKKISDSIISKCNDTSIGSKKSRIQKQENDLETNFEINSSNQTENLDSNQQLIMNSMSVSLGQDADSSTSKNQPTVDDNSCDICEQKLDDNLKVYDYEPKDGVPETDAIFNNSLLLFNGSEKEESFQEDIIAYNKITFFSIYCKNGHLCSLDAGLIEKDAPIFISGYVKPIHSENPSMEDGVAGINFGPIASWWITGFDIGETATIIVSTELGDYILMEPSEQYRPFFKPFMMKVLMSKLIIELIIYEPNAPYEKLISKLKSYSSIDNQALNFTEEMLLFNASFICKQLVSFDETAKPFESLLITAPCIRRMIDISGITFEHKFSEPSESIPRERSRNGKSRDYLRQLELNKNSSNPLIDQLLPFDYHVPPTLKKKTIRCGKCEFCIREPCRVCSPCENNYVGDCQQRRCFCSEIQEANAEDVDDTISDPNAPSSIIAYEKSIDKFAYSNYEISWVNPPIAHESGNKYYNSVKVDNDVIELGDFVVVRSIKSNVTPQTFKIIYMWEDISGAYKFHANYLWFGKDTILGESANKRELFFINRCCDFPIRGIVKKIQVDIRNIPNHWSEEVEKEYETFFCEKSYEPTTGHFYDLKFSAKVLLRKSEQSSHKFCPSCERAGLIKEYATPRPKDIIESNDSKTTYKTVLYKDEKYMVGSCVYLKPKTLYFKYPMEHVAVKKQDFSTIYTEEEYPEFYRKSNDTLEDNQFDINSLMDIGYITEIFTSDNELFIKVKKLYRPENIRYSNSITKQYDKNILFWNDEEKKIKFNYVVRKCYLVHKKHIGSDLSVLDWSILGPDRFYYYQSYEEIEMKEKSSWNKTEFNDISSRSNKTQDIPKIYPVVKKLKTLEIYAGCGGLSLGLQQAGIANCCWAVESNNDAASSYLKNSPETDVFVEESDTILEKILKGETKFNDKNLPVKNEVELLCSSLPCNDFKIMDIATFKKSPIATFLSYCTYFKPAFLVLESNEKLIRRSNVLKWTIMYLIKIGYQISFDLLQLGNYGAPRNEKRSVILGAAPNYGMPKFPNHLYAFPKLFCQSFIVIDGKKYSKAADFVETAAYKATSVSAAILDLPKPDNENEGNVMYYGRPLYSFQKEARLNQLQPTVFNHVYKNLDPIVQARISKISPESKCDWRNLPNVELQLTDNSFTNKLVYKYYDKTNGNLRGVCSCASGKKCDPEAKQQNTLIPWYLVHSANKHSNWQGLYGRLNEDGFFGAVGNPQPLGTKGPVLHPIQHRVVSVRECARSKGFPDDFVLPENIHIDDQYDIIARSASPLLARAIGYEIAKALELTQDLDR